MCFLSSYLFVFDGANILKKVFVVLAEKIFCVKNIRTQIKKEDFDS